jgi:hypothetical protein
MTPNPKPIQDGKDPALAWAEKLWKQLHTNLLGTQKTIIEIIRARAWEPLGYETFAKAWIDQMSDISIRVELIPHVIYALLDETVPVDEIAEIVKGVGPETVANYALDRENGVPADQARGRRKQRRGRSTSWTLFLHLGKERFTRWTQIAATTDRNLEDVAIDALDAHFAEFDAGDK